METRPLLCSREPAGPGQDQGLCEEVGPAPRGGRQDPETAGDVGQPMLLPPAG